MVSEVSSSTFTTEENKKDFEPQKTDAFEALSTWKIKGFLEKNVYYFRNPEEISTFIEIEDAPTPISFMLEEEHLSPQQKLLKSLSSKLELFQFYQASIFDTDIPCLLDIIESEKDNQPLSGLKLLINHHLDEATLLIVDFLIKLGAEITVTCMEPLFKNADAVEALKTAGITYVEQDELMKEARYHENYFDIICNCGISLGPIIPKFGIVELTHTENRIYEETKQKTTVINIDSSLSKVTETRFGTGDGCCRAIKENIEDFETICQEKQKIVIFGAGKVGTGILQALLANGVSPENICVIDPNQVALNTIKLSINKKIHNFQLPELPLSILKKNKEQPEQDIKEIEKDIKLLENIEEVLKQANLIITATGVKNCISKYFNKSNFSGNSRLINMGTDDEWGENFEATDIENEKKPFNFSLERPTEYRFLDPTFAMDIKACLLLASLAKNNGLTEMKGFQDYNAVVKKVGFEYTDYKNVRLWLDFNNQYECLLWEARNHETLKSQPISSNNCGLLGSLSAQRETLQSFIAFDSHNQNFLVTR